MEIKQLFEDKAIYEHSTSLVHNLLNEKNLIIYGAGFGLATFNTMVLKRFNIMPSLILDKKFQKKEMKEGITYQSPEFFSPSQKHINSSVVVITVNYKFHDEIYKMLKKIGYKHILRANDIYEYHTYFFENKEQKKGFDYFLNNKQNILSAFNLLNDTKSQEVFYQCLKTHMHRKPSLIEGEPTDEQYFPKDIKLKKGYNNFINCGAYVGDTLYFLNQYIGKVNQIIAIEPEINNFKKMSIYVKENQDNLSNQCILMPVGVHEKTQTLYFKSNLKVNSSVTKDGDITIQCISIDESLFNYKPTFIQMDVEGSEKPALKGAINTIKSYKPDLAICIYHHPCDLWEIILFLNNLNIGYNFYIRNYSGSNAETVLYATTNE